jgi:hypothetical protein
MCREKIQLFERSAMFGFARRIGRFSPGNLAGLRYDQWKAVFMEQQAHGFDVWAQPMVQLRPCHRHQC